MKIVLFDVDSFRCNDVVIFSGILKESKRLELLFRPNYRKIYLNISFNFYLIEMKIVK
jgi:hypothetical protein